MLYAFTIDYPRIRRFDLPETENKRSYGQHTIPQGIEEAKYMAEMFKTYHDLLIALQQPNVNFEDTIRKVYPNLQDHDITKRGKGIRQYHIPFLYIFEKY